MLLNKAKSLLILLLISFIPFIFVMYLWSTVPENAGLAGLVYIFGIPALFPISIIFIAGCYRFLSEYLHLAKLSKITLVLVPVILNLISTGWYFIQVEITRTQYFNRYEGLNLDARLLEGKLVRIPDQAVYNFAGAYSYKLLLKNPTDKEFKSVEMWVSVEYAGSDGTEFSLGRDILKLDIKPGDNVVDESMLIDSYDLRCRYGRVLSPLKLTVTQKILEKEKVVVLPLDSQLVKQLSDLNNNLENLNRGSSIPLRECMIK